MHDSVAAAVPCVVSVSVFRDAALAVKFLASGQNLEVRYLAGLR